MLTENMFQHKTDPHPPLRGTSSHGGEKEKQAFCQKGDERPPLELYFYVYSGGEVEFHHFFHCFRRGFQNIDEPFVDAHLELFP